MNDPLRLLDDARCASSQEVAASRRAILLAAAQRKPGRTRPAFVAALFLLVAPAAWAANALFAGHDAPLDERRMAPVMSSASSPVPRKTQERERVELPSEPPPPLTVAPPPAPVPKKNAASPAKPAASATSARELETIERAHRAHHHESAFGVALEAYDEYLARFPRGEFVPEARFGRAVVLEKLGRIHEARDAYEPFARGEYGTYRRADARDKLETLRP